MPKIKLMMKTEKPRHERLYRGFIRVPLEKVPTYVPSSSRLAGEIRLRAAIQGIQ